MSKCGIKMPTRKYTNDVIKRHNTHVKMSKC
jgi:hypothetical protein